MKKECTYTQRMLPRYLTGHLFRPQLRRIGRHLSVCPFCRSEHDALRRVSETREILRDIAPAEGMAGRVLRRASRLSGLTRLLYRPLLLLLVLGTAGAVYLYVITPLLTDPDLEKLDGGPAALTTAPSPSMATLPSLTLPGPFALPAAAPPAPAAQTDPLLITITIAKEEEKAAIARLNDAMQGHAFLNALRFSENVREIAGNLTADELYTFFDRIRGTGKVAYKRSRLASGSGEMIPFVIRLQASAAAKQPMPAQPVDKPVGSQGEKAVDIPVDKPGENRADAAVPAPPKQE
jgi:hypothetical protein